MKKKMLSLFLIMCILAQVFATVIPVYAIAEPPASETDEELSNILVNPKNSEGRELNFNKGWKFIADYIPEATAKDYSPAELQKWENVNLPHTVRLEKYASSGQGGIYMGDAMYIKHFPISQDNSGKKIFITFEGVMGISNVWVNGVKKTTKLASETGDATYYGGFLPFVIDITDDVICDGVTENVIVVYANSKYDPTVPPGKDPNALDFSYFGGIYRDVTITITDNVHITDANYENIVAGGGILVDYPSVSAEAAQVYVKTHVRNENLTSRSVYLDSKIVDRAGNVVAQATTGVYSFDASSDYSFEQTLTVVNPKLWDLDNPYLHELISTVYADGVAVDTVTTVIGIRKIEMHKDYGLKINGVVQDMLNGVNRHQEYAYIGYAASASLQRKDAMKFKEAGVNVVRTAHYPASEEFLNACDELGILIIEPTPGWQWYSSDPLFAARVKNDIRQMVRRDRNRPCMLAYETVLNETSSVPAGFTIGLAEVAKEEHPSAKVATENSVAEGEKDPVSDIMYKNAERSDFAVGFTREYGDSYREQSSPDNFFFRRVFRGTGMDYCFYPGGEGAMFLQAVKRLMGNQPDTPYYCPQDAKSGAIGGASGSSRSYLMTVESFIKGQNASEVAYIGATSWLGIDHNRTYYANMSACGLWDLLRLPKFSYYAMASQRPVETDEWLTSLGIDNGPMVFISSYWTEKAPVVDKTNEAFDTIGTDESRIILVYSNTKEVKLSVVAQSGDVLYEQTAAPMTGNNREYINAPFQFLDVPYTVGSHLVAVGYDAGGNELASHEVYTASTPAKVTLCADTMGIAPVADGSDTVMIYGYIKDANGTVCHDAYNKMTFTIVSGDAEIVGDGNVRVGANPVNAEAGIFGVYVKMGTTAGDIVIRVDSDGLEGSEITITSEEMTEPEAPYYLIPYTGSESNSETEYLSNLSYSANNNVSGMIAKINTGSVEANGETYRNSISFLNNFDVYYDVGGFYNRFSGAVTVIDNGNADAKGIFKVYADDRLVYVSNIVSPGEVVSFDFDIPECSVLRLRVVGLGHDIKNYPEYVWLTPVLTIGQETVDESEMYVNIALGKPTEASSVAQGSSSRFAVDGSVSSTWIGDPVGEGKVADPQYLIVDLRGTYKLCGVKVGLLNDSITYKYEIYTSSDKENWQKNATVAKTGQASDIIDFFSTEGVRYVKVLFNEIGTDEDRGQYSNATITELEVYEDRGVSSVTDFKLKNLGIEGKDMVFDPFREEYTVVLEGYETNLRIFAEAFNRDTTITVNGKEMTADTFSIAELPVNNVISVVATSASGKASTEYRIRIDGRLGNIFYDNAMNTMDEDKNGESRWRYQRFDSSAGAFVDIGSRWVYSDNQPYSAAENSSYSWTRMGAVFAHPGSGAYNTSKVSRTYIAPVSGEAELYLWAAKFYNINGIFQGGAVGLSVYQNGEKIWPSESEHIKLDGQVINEKISVTLTEGDIINFVVDNWDGGNGQDATYMDTTVCYKNSESLTYSEFLTVHEAVLAKSISSVTAEDKNAVQAALSDMAAASLEVRKHLVSERRHLEDLLKAIEIIEKGITPIGVESFSKTLSTVATFSLPETVTVYMSDGSELEASVTWEAFNSSMLQTPGSYKLTGKVDGYDVTPRFNLTVTSASQNKASTGFPMAFASYSNIKDGNGGDYVKLVNDGSYTGNWTTYRGTPTADEEWLGMIFGSGTETEAKTIDKILLTMPTITTYATQAPNLIKVQYYTGPAFADAPADPNNVLGTSHPLADDKYWTDATVISKEAFASQKTSAIVIEPVKSVAIRLVMTPNKRPNSNIYGCIGVVEMVCHEASPDTVNVAVNKTNTGFPMAFASYSNIKDGNGGDYVKLVNDGSYTGNWTTYRGTPTADEEWLGMVFGSGTAQEQKNIAKILLTMPTITTYATQVPNLIKVQYYTGPAFADAPADPNNVLGTSHPLADEANWTDAKIIDQEPFASQKTSAILIEPVDTVAIRLVMTANKRPSGGAGCIGIVEMACYGSPYGDSTPDVSGITVGGEALEGFSLETKNYTYKVQGGKVPDIDVIVRDNSSVIIQKPLLTNGVVQIRVIAENGEAYESFTIQLDDSETFELTVGKEFLIADIEAMFAGYSEANYSQKNWADLCGIFNSAKEEVLAYTDVVDVETFDLEGLRLSADSIKTQADNDAKGLKVNLTLSSDININFFAPVDGDILGISVDGIYLPCNEGTLSIGGVDYYVYSYKGVAPHRALEAFTVQIRYKEDGNALTKDVRYSIIKYALGVLTSETVSEEGKALVKDVVGFVKAAFEYFGNKEATAEEIEFLNEISRQYPATSVDFIPKSEGIDPSGISAVVESAQFSLADGIIRLRLNIKDTARPLAVTVNGKTVLSLKANHGNSYVLINMRAYQLCDTITLTSGDLVGTYSFLSYADGVCGNDEKLDSLLKAIYAYSVSASSYKDSCKEVEK